MRASFLGLCCLVLAGCNASSGAGNPLDALGGGGHSLDGVTVTEIGTAADRLNEPTDLAFNPGAGGELWVVNRADSSMVVFSATGTGSQTSERYRTASGDHFLAKPSALAFGADGSFATIHDEDQPTQGGATPADFMGPTLWTADREVFDAGDGGHLDMLHNSPLGAGIAWGGDNVYWVFDGFHSAISRYDFGAPHAAGGIDHSDGEIARYVAGDVAYLAGAVSHLEFDPASGLLYIADTGNARIAVLDTESGTRGSSIAPNYDGVDQFGMNGATLTTLVAAGGEATLQQPSGIALAGDLVFVTDRASSRILAFGTDGTLVDWLETGLPAGSLGGIEIRGGEIFVADMVGNRILRYAAK